MTTRALADSGIGAADLAAVGVTSQRETTVLWDRETGPPVHNAVVRQDRLTTDRVERLEREGEAEWVRERTGLEPDAYFSATKLEWLLDDSGEQSSPSNRGASRPDDADPIKLQRSRPEECATGRSPANSPSGRWTRG